MAQDWELSPSALTDWNRAITGCVATRTASERWSKPSICSDGSRTWEADADENGDYTERNYDELPQLKEWLIEKGVTSWRLLDVFPVGRAAKTPEVLLSDAHFRGLLEFIKDTRREGRILTAYGCEGFVGKYEMDVRDYSFFCKAGITVGSVLVDGSISACSSIRADYHQGNIYKDDFMDVWENRFKPYRDRSWMRRDGCAECNMFRYCKGSGMHLRDSNGSLLQCHLERVMEK